MARANLDRPRRLRLPLAAVLAAAVAGACAKSPEPGRPAAETPRRGGQAVVAMTADISGVNTLIAPTNTPSLEVMRHVFLQLTREQPPVAKAPPEFLPDLATSWEWSADRKDLTFHLRRDAFWTDGVPVTAEDVRFSWQAQIHPDIAWDSSFMKGSIEDVEVLDPHTARFHFDRAYPTQMIDAIEDFVLPKHVWGQVPFVEWRRRGDWFREHLVSAGPFRLAAWRPQEEIVLERNPTYYDPDRPRLDRVVIRIVPDQTNQIAQLLAGRLDQVANFTIDDAARIAAQPNLVLTAYWSRTYAYIAWNGRDPRFADPGVRKALTLGIDRQTIVDSVWRDRGRVASSPVLASMWGHHPDLRPHPYDPAEARRLLAERGYRDADGDGVVERQGRPLSFALMVNAGNRQRYDAAVLIQDQLAKIGVAARPTVLEFQTLAQRINGFDYEAAISAWTVPTSFDNRYAFHSSEIGGGSNFVAFSDPEVDAALDAYRAAPDLVAGLPSLLRSQELIHEKVPYTFLWETQRMVGYNRRLRDVSPNQFYVLFNLPDWWIDEAPAAGGS